MGVELGADRAVASLQVVVAANTAAEMARLAEDKTIATSAMIHLVAASMVLDSSDVPLLLHLPSPYGVGFSIHPQVREHLVVLGRALGWHGPLALDYLFDEAMRRPLYIEANPRLVEPMNATLSGMNMADLTVRVALGEAVDSAEVPCGQPGTRSHSLMALLLGIADHGGTRRDLLRAMLQAIWKSGIFVESQEDLTPLYADLFSLIPFGVVAGQLFCVRSQRTRLPQAPSTRTV